MHFLQDSKNTTLQFDAIQHQLPILPVEFAALDVDAVLSNSHAKVLHGEHRPPLATALTATTVSRPLNAEVVIFGF
jgi:hypothetical protein